MSFRILDPFQVYFDLDGDFAVGGNLHFYLAGTTTDENVYADSALTVNNGATVTIGTDGKAMLDIWGDSAKSYRCRVYDVDNTLVKDVDNIAAPGGTGGGSIPALVPGDFLTNDGTNLLWTVIRQALDPTSQANKIMGSDGTNLIWVDKPSDGGAGSNASVTIDGSGVKWNGGTGDLFYIQVGSGTCAASGAHNASTSVSYPNAFKTILGVFPVVTSKSASANYNIIMQVLNASTTGFTADFNTNSSDGNNGVINTTVNFKWVAFGTVAP